MVKIVFEIGINHNGKMELAKKLIDISAFAGADYVKFQKRDPDTCVSEEQKKKMRVMEDGREVTYLEYRKEIEFGKDEYTEIAFYCVDRGIKFFASVWDIISAEFMKEFSDIAKIPSAKLTDIELLKFCRSEFDFRILSTGMSMEKEIERAIEILNPQVVMHTNSSYPARPENLRLQHIRWLREKYNAEIGYSGHEWGLGTTYPVIALGATWIERHITLDHNMWGSDHAASIDPIGAIKLVRSVRDIEKALELGYSPREIYPEEEEKRAALR